MVSSSSLFTDIHSIPPTSIKLPNGSLVLVTHVGTVQLSPTLHLHNILCVPSFGFNLILANKLTQDLSCCLIFLNTHCFIQDLKICMKIVVGKNFNGLYYLLPSQINSIFTALSYVQPTSIHTWHCRRDHVSPCMHLLNKHVP